MATKIFTRAEVLERIDPEHLPVVNRWLERGDGIAVYQNVELGNPHAGKRQYCSFGSQQAQLETLHPPTTLPDIGSNINWRYYLEGIYRGERL